MRDRVALREMSSRFSSRGTTFDTVVPAVAGMVSGHALHVAIVAAGVAALVARYPTALTALTLIGAASLVWLGALTLLRPALPQAGDAPPVESWVRRALTGAGCCARAPRPRSS